METRRYSRRSVLRVGAAAAAAPLLDAMQVTPIMGISALLDGSGMVRIPPGEFSMGSTDGNADEQPVHRVRITRAFEIGKFEVTQMQWEGGVRDAHMKPDVVTNHSHFKGDDLPVESVSWEEVDAFMKRLNARDDTHNYRLPTEAEWEYVCRAGTPGRGPANLAALAWNEQNSSGRTQPVGKKQPNALGMFDTLGNVAEWVQDWYGRDYYGDSPAADPQGPAMGSYRVYRGGCWLDPAKNCRPAYRGFDFPSSQYYNVGFRVVRTAK